MKIGILQSSLRPVIFTILFVFTLCSLPAAVAPLVAAAGTGPQESTATSSSQTDSAHINALIAGLSDEQVRKLLIAELQKKSATDSATQADKQLGPEFIFGDILNALSDKSDSSEQKVKQLLASIPDFFPDLYKVFLTLCPFGTSSGALTNIGWVVFFILTGLFIELAFKRMMIYKLFSGVAKGEIPLHPDGMDKFLANLVKELPNILGILLFFAGAYAAFIAFIWTESPFVQLFFLALLISITLIRVISISSRILLAPTSATFRILPLPDHMARTSYTALVWVSSYMILILMFIVVVRKLGAQENTVKLLQLLFATLLLTVTAIYVLLYKAQIKEQIISAAEIYGKQASWGRRQFAAIWHLLAIAYLVILWLLLFNNLIDPGQKHRGAFILSFFVLPIWMVSDNLLQWLVKYAMATLRIHKEHYEDEGEEVTEEEIAQRARGKQTFLRTMTIARIGLVFSLIIWIASLWNINIPVFSNLSSVLFDSLIILTAAILFWQFISSWIERKIQESIPEEEENKEDQDDEWGSAAARGRSYTLLPMLRKFIGTILVTMVTMTILSSTGVDIGPLLAGAGVVGLAVGFGAQKLVADMFSGFFYLLDDAFRVGEYVEAGGISGTVENISLRNVMLRHHRGMLQIVPHSELGAITNYMRGGIIVKFNLDFPYDADIDQIRKIIKKVGQSMLEDEEVGKDFIRPVKSQGVREISNSVMTIRVKFTAKPGAHFIIRREAYKRITEALRAKGITYAHKKVIVDIPQQSDARTEEQIIKAAGAAAREAIDAEEQNTTGAGGKQMPFDS